MSTTVVYVGTNDGHIISGPNAGDYAAARDGTGTLVASQPSQPWVGQWNDYSCEQYFAAFDSSAIDDTDTVSAAVLELWITSNQSTTDFTLQAFSYDWSTTVTTADFRTATQLAALTLLGGVSTAGISTGAYLAFSDTAFAAAITKTGETRIVVASDRNAAGTTPTTGEEVRIYSSVQTGTTNDPKVTITHTASSGATGTGAVTLPPAAVSGTGTLTITGTGALTLPPAAVSGTGTETFTATGALTLPPASVSGTGTETMTATGAVTLQPAAVSGVGIGGAVGTGAVTLQPVSVSGTGSHTAGGAPTGDGAVTLQPVSVAGAGSLSIPGTGALTLKPAAVSGTGTLTITGTGALTLKPVAIAGVGTEQFAGVGAIVVPSILVAGLGSEVIAGTGAITLQPIAVSGSEVVETTVAGPVGSIVAAQSVPGRVIGSTSVPGSVSGRSSPGSITGR